MQDSPVIVTNTLWDRIVDMRLSMHFPTRCVVTTFIPSRAEGNLKLEKNEAIAPLFQIDITSNGAMLRQCSASNGNISQNMPLISSKSQACKLNYRQVYSMDRVQRPFSFGFLSSALHETSSTKPGRTASSRWKNTVDGSSVERPASRLRQEFTLPSAIKRSIRHSDARYDENLFTPSQKLSAEHGNLIHGWKRGERKRGSNKRKQWHARSGIERDIKELITGHENDPTEELQELLDEKHQDTQSSSEKGTNAEDISYQRSFEGVGGCRDNGFGMTPRPGIITQFEVVQEQLLVYKPECHVDIFLQMFELHDGVGRKELATVRKGKILDRTI
ncbi:hypothetical protein WN51_06178 [Melipona quadrifasciata]|uniref:Uncharacterized protein n=1 Tax=Melipona quadrifasciata TaxID=166423 RepID=A0A0M8ZQL7_9HYME|nr:hypothetical protein WN51_06178 [Melipona quadrifasciata]